MLRQPHQEVFRSLLQDLGPRHGSDPVTSTSYPSNLLCRCLSSLEIAPKESENTLKHLEMSRFQVVEACLAARSPAPPVHRAGRRPQATTRRSRSPGRGHRPAGSCAAAGAPAPGHGHILDHIIPYTIYRDTVRHTYIYILFSIRDVIYINLLVTWGLCGSGGES